MRIARAVASGIAITVLTVGVFVALLAYGRLPSSDELVDLPNEMLTDTTVFILLTLLAWAAWVGFTCVIALEIAAEVTGNRRWRPPAGLPFQTVARRLVTALTMSVTLSGPVLARVGPMPSLAASAAAATAELHPSSALGTAPPLVITAVDGLPTVEQPAASVPVVVPEGPAPAEPAVALPVVTVVPHDSPWALAERHLGQGLRWREIWDLNRGTPQPDGRAWIREDLIQPGWQLQLPADAINVVAPPPPPPQPAPEAPAPVTDTPGPEVAPAPDSANAGADHAAPHDDREACDTADVAAQADRAEPTRPSSPSTTSPSGSAGDDQTSAASSGLLPVLGGVTGATIVATGLAYQLRQRRRRRSSRTARVPWGPDTATERQTEEAIAAASDLPLVQWAGHHLADLTSAASGSGEAGPVAVELSPETGMELLWDIPNPKAPPPWVAADGGWAWRLAYDPDGALPPNDQPAGIPGLVTIGRRADRQLLVDLEAFGSLSLAGDPEHSADLVRAMVYELGTSEELASAQVVLADLDLDLDVAGAEQLPRVRNDTAEGALDRIRGTTSAVDDALQSTSLSSTFAYRADAWIDVTVVIVGADNPHAEALVEASGARRGVATIVVGPIPAAAAHITARPDGAADLEPLGLTFDLAGLPPTSAADVATLLEALDTTPATDAPSDESGQPPPPLLADVRDNGSESSTSATAGDIEPEPSSNGAEPQDAGPPLNEEPVWPQLMVKVLGQPHIPDRPGLKRRELALAVYLASKGQPTPAASVQHAVWNGRAVQAKTIWNLATATRATLGQLDDGTAAMPASQRAHNTLALAPGVRTDLQVLQDLYEHAEQAPSAQAMNLLQQGLDLIEGQPYDGADFEWAHHTELLVAHATRLIESATERLVELALDARRIDLAQHAITQGLRALPGNEVLYRARMTVEHEDGNLAGVRSAYDELVSYLADIDTDPSQATIDLYRRLLTHRGRHAS